MTTPAGPTTNGNRNLFVVITIMVAFLGVGAAIVSTMTGSNNAQVLLLQEQQRTEKENRESALTQLRQRLERIEGRSVAESEKLDLKLQKEFELSDETLEGRLDDLNKALQDEFGGTLTAQAEDNIRERSDADKHTNFEARLSVLEAAAKTVVR